MRSYSSYYSESESEKLHFKLLTRTQKIKKIHFKLLNPNLNFYFFTFELLTWSWKLFIFSLCYYLVRSINFYFLAFELLNQGWNNKKVYFELLTRWANFYFFTFESNVKLKNEKNPINITVPMFVNHENMSWGCPGILKCRNGIDVVFNRWKSIICLFYHDGRVVKWVALLRFNSFWFVLRFASFSAAES